MSSQQRNPVVPPAPTDTTLSDFAQQIQDNLSDLFDALIDIQKITTVPGSNDGRVFSMRVIKVSTVWRFYIKVDSTTWKYVALT